MSLYKFLAAFCAVVALPAATFAMNSAQLTSALQRFDDGNGAQQIARLDARIRAEDGPLLSEIADLAQHKGNVAMTCVLDIVLVKFA
ncbi:hypothetical protein [Rhizobium sp. CF142]|jgi:hypothetical protein|uniref:hypothetical protein n=1 Tax=Rhizobium sp. CF142 TaxID=1144314 RepID=UPI00026EFEED|nr:hypothetical protein [Rhizobium sp. CF142]EJJ28665.1 hypothetical protein PMI11_03046 [Rhizobium sp. CF142]MDR6669762.1 hypothetical protein [Rhizobium sp. 1399]